MKSSIEAKPERVSKHLSYRPAFDSRIKADARPMVVIYGWLVAKSRHIHKYGDYYLGQGFDVLHVKIQPDQMMWPVWGQKIVSQVMDFISDVPHAKKPLLMHGFSVGGHLIGESYVQMKDFPDKYNQVGERMKGQIFDSPVDYAGVPYGFGKAVTKIPVVQKAITGSLVMYLNMFQNQVKRHFVRSSERIHENPYRVPTLVLTSRADTVSPWEPIEKVLDGWRSQGMSEIYTKIWNDSPHVSHFLYHPVEYIQQLNMFLDKIGLKQPTPQVHATEKLQRFGSG